MNSAEGAILETGNDSSSRSSAPANTDHALFQCGDCKKSYTRVDHLARHVRSHTQEKPYTCPICRKGFARPDLVKRHAASHAPNEEGSAKRQKRDHSHGHSSRVSSACRNCALSKLKCEEEKPCRRCSQKGLTCESPLGENRLNVEGRGTHLAPDAGTLVSETQFLESDIPQSGFDLDDPDNRMGNGSAQMIMTQDVPVCRSSAQLPTPNASLQTLSTPSLHSDETGVLAMEENFFPDFLRELMMPASFEFSTIGNPLFYPSRADTPLYTMDFGIDANLELSDLDMGFLDAFNGKNQVLATLNPPGGPPQDDTHLPVEGDEEGYEFRRGVELGAEAFRKSSLWGWTPAHADHGYAEQGNLTLPVADANSPEARLNFDRQILNERLSPSSRDKILAMVLGTCKPGNISRVVSAFPSAEVLDNLMQHFFDRSSFQIDSWIHTATFRTNAQIPELLAAIVAAGAVSTPLLSVRKLGFALQEAVRLALPEKFENDNAMTRDLQCLQAYAMHLEVGLWSGNRRKIEIAESFEQPLLTMLRRGGRFTRAKYPSVTPKPEDDGESLERKWRDWVETESFKKLVLHCFLHDTQVSMALHSNPLLSYAEVSLPFPEPKDLWRAPTASHWKQLYLSKYPQLLNPEPRLPSLADTIQNWSLLPAHTHRIDPQLAGLVITHGIWTLVWEHRQLTSICKSPAGNWSGLILSSRHQELCQLLHHFRMGSSEWGVEVAPEVRLLLETLSMHLHMSFEELQLFAGKEDKEEAKRVYVSARQWIDSQGSRQAVWHAGQAIRAAKEFPTNQLKDFYAIALYHAGLAFWAYGIVSKAKETASWPLTNHMCTAPSTLATLWLDGEETAEVHKFIAMDRGVPGLRKTDQEVTLLRDTGAVTDLVREVLRRNFSDDIPPPLVENLSQLMKDLGSAARAIG